MNKIIVFIFENENIPKKIIFKLYMKDRKPKSMKSLILWHMNERRDFTQVHDLRSFMQIHNPRPFYWI